VVDRAKDLTDEKYLFRSFGLAVNVQDLWKENHDWHFYASGKTKEEILSSSAKTLAWIFQKEF